MKETTRKHLSKSLPASAKQHKTAGPYSPVLVVDPGKLVVLSGQAAIDEDGKIVGETIEEQTLYMMQNCKIHLSVAGCGLNDVFKVTVYLKNMDDWPAFNAIYKDYFEEPRPVRTAVQAGLIGELLVEIEIWATTS
ncbi:RidA family protein [Membranicola marinus]|uniref:RidA family protein n=1 Tax=Membranihabitans marinus TaxID=1227546 RepID=A0A953HPN2_9BACT|nr:RidA family protein [Membranihabitans marinus]MBY5958508.1 RidA family protein [Membranihabitans marinus]